MKTLVTLSVVMLVTVSVGACRARYNVQSLSGQKSLVLLDPNATVFVTVPQDGAHETRLYPGSGQVVTQAVAAAFSTVAPNVVLADKHQSDDENFSLAKDRKASYLIVPLIAHWEQRATEWSARPSRLSIRVSVYDVDSRSLIRATVVEGRSRIVTLFPTTPQSLLSAPLKSYVTLLYGNAR